MRKAIYVGDKNNTFLGTISIDTENKLIVEVFDLTQEMEILDILSPFAADDESTQPFARKQETSTSLIKLVHDDSTDLEHLAGTLRGKGYKAIVSELNN